MGYHTVYPSDSNGSHKKTSSLRLPFLIFLCFALFIILTEHTWPEGAAVIHSRIFLNGHAVTASALNHFADKLRNGENVMSAFYEFLRNLLP